MGAVAARGGRGRGMGSASRAFTRVAGGAAAAGARHGRLSLRCPTAGIRTMVAMAAVVAAAAVAAVVIPGPAGGPCPPARSPSPPEHASSAPLPAPVPAASPRVPLTASRGRRQIGVQTKVGRSGESRQPRARFERGLYSRKAFYITSAEHYATGVYGPSQPTESNRRRADV